jgi:hypothetical protein
VYVAKAAAGGTTFGAAVEASDPSGGFTYANPWMFVTPMGTPMVTFERSGVADMGVVAARSTDMGATWATSVVATDTHLLNVRTLPSPCASVITGRVFVTYFSDDPAVGTSIGIGWSDDDGVTWIPPLQSPLVSPSGSEQPVGMPPRCVAVESSVRVIFGYAVVPGTPNPSSLPAMAGVEYSESVDDGATFDVGGDDLIDLETPSSNACADPQLIADGAGGFDLTYHGFLALSLAGSTLLPIPVGCPSETTRPGTGTLPAGDPRAADGPPPRIAVLGGGDRGPPGGGSRSYRSYPFADAR